MGDRWCSEFLQPVTSPDFFASPCDVVDDHGEALVTTLTLGPLVARRRGVGDVCGRGQLKRSAESG